MTGIEGLFNRFIFNGYCQEYEQVEKLCFCCEFLQKQKAGVNVGRFLLNEKSHKIRNKMLLLVHTLEYCIDSKPTYKMETNPNLQVLILIKKKNTTWLTLPVYNAFFCSFLPGHKSLHLQDVYTNCIWSVRKTSSASKDQHGEFDFSLDC